MQRSRCRVRCYRHFAPTEPGKQKTRTRSAKDAMVRVSSSRLLASRLTDEHFILSVSLVNGLRYWSYENFESATEARHNRRHLAGGFNDLALYEISS